MYAGGGGGGLVSVVVIYVKGGGERRGLILVVVVWGERREDSLVVVVVCVGVGGGGRRGLVLVAEDEKRAHLKHRHLCQPALRPVSKGCGAVADDRRMKNGEENCRGLTFTVIGPLVRAPPRVSCVDFSLSLASLSSVGRSTSSVGAKPHHFGGHISWASLAGIASPLHPPPSQG